ncbi:hypothetical protein MXAN_0218 [Myxococcus xanthus DK 1622]|uniref:Uncharacterized protein n=1 Tax=Myxococcus xanthus (strain DK1622) TaxID=246197 RepID=Q1DFS3_MYXXD|nr:hypothetical protein MXAN_0218 [Myxococcus xanthus DK 1622]
MVAQLRVDLGADVPAALDLGRPPHGRRVGGGGAHAQLEVQLVGHHVPRRGGDGGAHAVALVGDVRHRARVVVHRAGEREQDEHLVVEPHRARQTVLVEREGTGVTAVGEVVVAGGVHALQREHVRGPAAPLVHQLQVGGEAGDVELGQGGALRVVADVLAAVVHDEAGRAEPARAEVDVVVEVGARPEDVARGPRDVEARRTREGVEARGGRTALHQALEGVGVTLRLVVEEPQRQAHVGVGPHRVDVVTGDEPDVLQARVVARALVRLRGAQRHQAQLGQALVATEDGDARGIAAQEAHLVAGAGDVRQRRARGVVDVVVDWLRAHQQRQLTRLARGIQRDVDVLRLDVDLVGVEAAALVLLERVGRPAPHVVDFELGPEGGQPVHEVGAVLHDGNPSLLDEVRGQAGLGAHRASRGHANGAQRHAAKAGRVAHLVLHRHAREEVVDEAELTRLRVLVAVRLVVPLTVVKAGNRRALRRRRKRHTRQRQRQGSRGPPRRPACLGQPPPCHKHLGPMRGGAPSLPAGLRTSACSTFSVARGLPASRGRAPPLPRPRHTAPAGHGPHAEGRRSTPPFQRDSH